VKNIITFNVLKKFMLNYNKILKQLLFIPPCVESVVQRLHFQFIVYVF